MDDFIQVKREDMNAIHAYHETLREEIARYRAGLERLANYEKGNQRMKKIAENYLTGKARY